MSRTDPRPASELVQTTVAEAMSRPVVSCLPSTPLDEVAELMAGHGIHAVVLVAEDGLGDDTERLCGIVSDTDLVAGVSHRNIDRQTALEATTSPLVTIRPTARLARAAELMASLGVTHVVVTTQGPAHPVGVLSTLDVARTLA
jgi:CBS domain-containing protein